jgi:hypothetical protein
MSLYLGLHDLDQLRGLRVRDVVGALRRGRPGLTPPFAQSLRLLRAFGGAEKGRLPMIDGSPCEVTHSTTEAGTGLAGFATSRSKPEVALIFT